MAGIALAGCATSGPPPDMSGAPASDSASLFKAANLTPVVTQAGTHLPAGVPLAEVKIAPRAVTVVATTTTVIVDAQGRWLEVVTPARPVAANKFILESVHPQVVQRLASRAAKASHTSLQGVAYVATVSNPQTHRVTWAIYMTDHRVFLADLNGSGFHAGRGISPGATTGRSAVPGTAKQVVSCIRSAAGDATKIAACTGP